MALAHWGEPRLAGFSIDASEEGSPVDPHSSISVWTGSKGQIMVGWKIGLCPISSVARVGSMLRGRFGEMCTLCPRQPDQELYIAPLQSKRSEYILRSGP